MVELPNFTLTAVSVACLTLYDMLKAAEKGMVIEGVRQMRGESVNQVAGAKTCVVSNQGGIMHTHATLILGQ